MKRVLGVIALLAGVRLVVGALFPLIPDEAYYWVWSRFPSWGYLDHPPMVAWWVWLGTRLLGDTYLGVRLLAILGSALASLFLYLTAKEVLGERKAFHALLAGSFALLFGVGSVLQTPDAPLLVFWAGALWAGVKRRWPLWGLFTGLALLSKLTALLLLALPLVEWRRTRRWPSVALGYLLALTLWLPNLLWNAQNQWVSIAFQLHHGAGGAFKPLGGLKYLADAALVLTPPLSIMLGIGIFRFRKEPVLQLGFWLPFLAFFLASFKGSAEANWPAPAYLSLFVLGVGGLRLGKLWKGSLAFAAFVLALVYAHAVKPFLPVKGDPTDQARGWAELAACVAEVRAEFPSLKLAAPRYQEASELWFYLKEPVLVIDPRGRPSEITRRFPLENFVGESFIYIGRPRGKFRKVLLLRECLGKKRYNIYWAIDFQK